MNLNELSEENQELLLIITVGISAALVVSDWIAENYYLLEYLFVILLFGLVHEAWSNFQTDDTSLEFIQIFGGGSRVMMQAALLVLIGGSVIVSLELQRFVESKVGPLSVVQMLSLIVVLSRAYVNVYDSRDIAAVLDGRPDTYATYTAGLSAFLISWKIRSQYPVQGEAHNMITIASAILIAGVLFYYFDFSEYLPTLSDSHS
ncbi:hypothetical protein ACFO0N_01165 [Halobium salinum]|uniref:Uncharacterized protein n=1 Tax=Halobium salinum TaxID=1364940 RepID=A0ABD5P7S1_9EURY|nr:hypothetical protein [Halobium salinum]